MKLTSEEKQQRVSVLLCDLDELYKDLAWLKDMEKSTTGAGKRHYSVEVSKCELKIEDVKSKLTRLRAVH